MDTEVTPEVDWLQLLQLEGQIALSMDNYELFAKDFYERKAIRESLYGWADYFNEQAAVDLTAEDDYLRRLEQAETVMVRPQNASLSLQLVLSALPFPEQIKRLDLTHNNWSGRLDLSRFTNLEYLALAGNPFLAIADSSLPPALRHIVLTNEEKTKLDETDFHQKFPRISISQNGAPEFSLGSAPFQEPEMVKIEEGKFWMAGGRINA